MKKVTITLADRTVRRARMYAAKRKMSLSRYIGEALRGELYDRPVFRRR